MKEELRIVYMGTPDFAVAPLKALLDSGKNIVGVITAPDKPAGRGKKIQSSAVKVFAEEKGLKILQPTNLKDPMFHEELKALKANLQVVVAFRMLPEVVWNMPKYGTFNLHASLLPQYRGAAPINWAVINGEKETGVTTFFLRHEIDTGDVIFQEKVEIAEEDNVGVVHDKLMNVGASLVVKTVDVIQNDDYTSVPQDHFDEITELKSAPKIFKDDCMINWDQPVRIIYDFIRGLSPYPTAFSKALEANNKEISIKIFNSRILNSEVVEAPGTIITDDKSYLRIACQKGVLEILELQMPGKKRMKIEDFLRGYSMKNLCKMY
ncbi:MAG: methionyl-tRNA formyltransferase [Hyphomicrobiales bacterium]